MNVLVFPKEYKIKMTQGLTELKSSLFDCKLCLAS